MRRWCGGQARQLRSIQAAGPELQAGLANLTGQQMRFRHPLARSAAYWSMSPEERQQIHAALAEATDAEADPDRRAWHRAAAAPGPDEEVAAELEDLLRRPRGRGGLAAAMAFFERAVLLTGDPGRRAGHALAAAQASLQVGAFDRALELLTVVDAGPLDDLQRARATLLRGQIAFARGLGRDSSPLLLNAARQLEPLDPALARQTYLEAWQAAMFAGHLVVGADLTEISRSARHLPPANPQRPTDQLLDGLSLLGTEGPAAAESKLREAVTAFATAEITPDEVLQWGWMATAADDALFGHGGSSVTARQIRLARDVGALGQLPLLLNRMAGDEALSGDFEAKRVADCGGRDGLRSDRDPYRPLGRHVVSRFAGPRRRGDQSYPGHPGGGHGRRSGIRDDMGALDSRHPLQRAQPLRRGPGCGATCQRPFTYLRVGVGASGAD